MWSSTTVRTSVGVRRAQPGEAVGDERRERRREAAQPQPTGTTAADLRQRLLRVVELGGDHPPVPDQDGAGLGQLQRPGAAVDEGQPGLALERRDVLADGGLGHPEAARSSRERPLARRPRTAPGSPGPDLSASLIPQKQHPLMLIRARPYRRRTNRHRHWGGNHDDYCTDRHRQADGLRLPCRRRGGRHPQLRAGPHGGPARLLPRPRRTRPDDARGAGVARPAPRCPTPASGSTPRQPGSSSSTTRPRGATRCRRSTRSR